MNATIGALVLVMGVGGLIAGMIAYSRIGSTTGVFVGYFIFGALFPLIGIVAACLVKPDPGPPQPPGWYDDPWRQASYRWWDGTQWIWQTG